MNDGKRAAAAILMAVGITDEEMTQAITYRPVCCPVCGEGDIAQLSKGEIGGWSNDSTTVTMTYSCASCDSKWDEDYKFVRARNHRTRGKA